MFEKLPLKAAYLAGQRPTWAVYETDCVRTIREGAGNHLDVNFLDLDLYGEPWLVLSAFFESPRKLPERLVIVVNDGLRKSLRFGVGWHARSLEAMCAKYGNAWLCKHYLAVCQAMLRDKAKEKGYTLRRWTGYYCGHLDTMTHYAAVLGKT